MQAQLNDGFGRSFRYLRVSVTDACNFRCVYCLPNGYCKDPEAAPPLDQNEFRNLVAGFAAMGVVKIRITGGEPTLRRDVVTLVEIARSTPGIETVALSTNGYRLLTLLPELKSAGLDAVNISIDSLRPEAFAEVTGVKRLVRIREGVEAAADAGFKTKVNAVLMRGVNDEDLPHFLDFIKERPISVRFIELMRTGGNRELFEKHHLPAEHLENLLTAEGWQLKPRGPTDGPAREYEHHSFAGRIGVIAPYGKGFCENCNRLRISCRGELKLCLFGDGQNSVRAFLQRPDQKDELHAAVAQLLGLKKVSHLLHEGHYGNTQQFSSIGG
jgi:cyclic pyranopterin phosphate synthase